jgi:cyclase
MLRPRIISCLLVHQGRLVKTQCFKDPKYVGNPINAVRIFNEKEVDELMVLSIDATVNKEAPNFTLIAKLAAECRTVYATAAELLRQSRCYALLTWVLSRWQ